MELLKDEFLNLPIRHITNTFKEQKTLYKTFGVLEEQLRNYKRIKSGFSTIGKPRNKRGIEIQLIERGSQLPKELHAAKKRNEVEAGKSSTYKPLPRMVLSILSDRVANKLQPNVK